MAPHLAEVMEKREENPTAQRVTLPLGAACRLPTAIPLSVPHHTEMRVLLFPPAFSPLQLLPSSPSPPKAEQPRDTRSRDAAALGIGFAKELGKRHHRVLCCLRSLGAVRALGARLVCRNTIN